VDFLHHLLRESACVCPETVHARPKRPWVSALAVSGWGEAGESHLDELCHGVAFLIRVRCRIAAVHRLAAVFGSLTCLAEATESTRAIGEAVHMKMTAASSRSLERVDRRRRLRQGGRDSNHRASDRALSVDPGRA
jgi:hypothetical protein